MIDAVAIAISFLGGIVMSLFYFGGLWWTVSQFQNTRNTIGFYLASLLVRTLVLILCIIFLLQVGIVNLLVAMVGFMICRLILVRKLAFPTGTRTQING